MLGIEAEVIEHPLSVNSEIRVVEHRKKSFNTEKYMAIVEEVDRLLALGFIRETHYLE